MPHIAFLTEGAMKLPFATKYNGIFYKANEEIPAEQKKEQPEVKKPEIEVESKVETKRKTIKK